MKTLHDYVVIKLPTPAIELYVKKKNWQQYIALVKKTNTLTQFVDSHTESCRNNAELCVALQDNVAIFRNRFRHFVGLPIEFLRNEILAHFFNPSNCMFVSNIAFLSELFVDQEIYYTYVDAVAMYNFIGHLQGISETKH